MIRIEFFRTNRKILFWIVIQIHSKVFAMTCLCVCVSFDIQCELMFISLRLLVSCNLFSHCRQFHLNTKTDLMENEYNDVPYASLEDRLKCQGVKWQMLCKRTSCVVLPELLLHSFILFQWDYVFSSVALCICLPVFLSFITRHKHVVFGGNRDHSPLFICLLLFIRSEIDVNRQKI